MNGNIDISITVLVEGDVEIASGASDIRAHVDIGDQVTILAKDPGELERLAEALVRAADTMRRIRWDARMAAVSAVVSP